MRHNRTWRVRLLFLALLFLAGPVWGQDVWLYPPIEIDAETNATLQEASRLTGVGRYTDARDLFLQVSTAKAGTSVGASALLSAANLSIMAGDANGARTHREAAISSVSLNNLAFIVDGVERHSEVSFTTEIDRTLTQGVNFEVLTLELQPVLTPGLHTVTIRAQASSSGNDGLQGPATSEVTWSFTVTTPQEVGAKISSCPRTVTPFLTRRTNTRMKGRILC